MLAVAGVVGTVGVDAELELGGAGEVYGEVFELLGAAGGAEGELLPAEFDWGLGALGGVEAELLGALGGAVDDVHLDAAEVLGGVEEEADDLRA